MKICHIQTRMINGGADENTLLSCNGQAKNGHEVTLIYGRDYETRMIDQAHPDVTLVRVESLQRAINPWRDLQALAEIRKILRKRNPDIVHTHTSKAGIIGRIAARQAGDCRIVHGVHILPYVNVGIAQKTVYLQLERYVSRFTDAYICVSDGMMEQNIAHGVGNDSNSFVVHSGMDLKRFRHNNSPNWREVLKGHVIPFETPNFVLLMGAFEKRKRHIPFISEFSRVVDQHPNAVLLLAGDGLNREKIEEAIERLGLKKNVILLGFRNDAEDLISIADVCVHPSEREGLARVLMQYSLGGKPIICSHNPGVEAIVRHEENGFVVPIDGLPQMADKLAELLCDDEKRARFAEHSSMMDLSSWCTDAMIQSIDKVYHQIVPVSRGYENLA